MIKAILTVFINLIGSLVQVVTFLPNQLISTAFPDISNKIIDVSSNITGIFSCMTWALSFIPPYILDILVFIFTCEIAKHTVRISTETLNKIWYVFGKIKIW